jgi:hypothetical protein
LKPFGGFIYPYGFFDKCILFVGHGEKEVKLTMSQDICGAPPPPLVPGYSQRTNPFIEVKLLLLLVGYLCLLLFFITAPADDSVGY